MTDAELRSLIRWHSRYLPAYDGDPWRYVHEGILLAGRSRRLGVLNDPARGFRAYLGVQHFDPGEWDYRGEAYCKFFLSLRLKNAGVELRTYPTMEQALGRLKALYTTLIATPQRPERASS